jgi:hypothetical protein
MFNHVFTLIPKRFAKGFPSLVASTQNFTASRAGWQARKHAGFANNIYIYIMYAKRTTQPRRTQTGSYDVRSVWAYK